MTTKILIGDCRDTLRRLEDKSVHCVVTSPPYWGLRSYKRNDGMIGLESTFEKHVDNLMSVFDEVRRVMRDDATLWLNYGDRYQNGQLMMMPSEIASVMKNNNWILRSEIVWSKTNSTPEPVKNRPTCAHEKLFLFSKKKKYYYDQDAVRQKPTGRTDTISSFGRDNPDRSDRHRVNAYTLDGNVGANMKNVWHIATESFEGAHFATFPTKLVEPCIKAGTRERDVVLDPFGGAGTVALVAERLRRDSIICEISAEYAEIARQRIERESMPMFPTQIEISQ